MSISRRSAMAGLGAGALSSQLVATPASRKTRLQTSLEQAAETLRLAMISGDGAMLDRLLHDRLDYMHSSGQSQTKSMLLADLAGKRFFADLIYAQSSIEAIGHTGLVKLTVDQVKNLAGGKTRASRIKVLQVWTPERHGWQLLARSSAIISSPVVRRCGVEGTTQPADQMRNGSEQS